MRAGEARESAKITIRSARWPDDLRCLAEFDTSFTTDRVYRIVRGEASFTLVEDRIDPPLHKYYGSITHSDDRLQVMEPAIIAEQGGGVAGFAAAEYEAWNRRMIVRHLYVAARCRRGGVGRALLHELEVRARSAGARCLWLETQNVNFPAIQFYRRIGFRLCGLDESLYDPAGPAGGEVALFFARELACGEAAHARGA